jgi:hypothetical protein
MGFLDHSTNNIIIDAVLTDYGRRLLADGSGDFVIASFSLADDEVDYGMITKFGRTVGKEKITKNTPIFEAQTKGSSAVKHRMITLPNPAITRIPTIKFSDAGIEASGVVPFVRRNGSYQPLSVRMTQTVAGDATLNPDGLTDSLFTIFVNSRFMSVDGGVALSEEPVSRIAAFSKNSSSAGEVNFTLRAKQITNETFTQFGIVSGAATVITTPVTIVGNQTGLRKDFKVTLSNQEG